MNLKRASFPVSAPLDTITINCHIFRIRVLGSEDDKVELSWQDTATRHLEIDEQKRGLAVTDRAAVTMYGPLSLINLKQNAQLLVKVPKEFAGKLVLQSTHEHIHLTDVTTRGWIGVSTSTGEIVLEQVRSQVIDIRGDHGKVNCFGIDAAELIDISTQNGGIVCTINADAEEYTASIESDNRRSTALQTSGHGDKRLHLASRLGVISLAFRGDNPTRTADRRYNRRNSFRDW